MNTGKSVDAVARLAIGSLLIIAGAFRLWFPASAIFSVIVEHGRFFGDYLGGQIIDDISALSIALMLICAGLGIVFRKARGTSTALCTAIVAIEALLIFQFDFEARRNDWPWEYVYEYWAFHGTFALLSLGGLVYLLLPHRRSIQASSRMTDLPRRADQEDWHARLLASLRDTGVEAPPDRFILSALAFAGFFVIVTATSIIGRYVIPAVPALIIVWVVFAIAVLARFRNFLLRRAWQARARSADEELLRSNGRRPVLYLRSFALDERLAAPSFAERFLGVVPLATAEQMLTRGLRRCGPVIAIGRPGEALPVLGAARFYVSHARWQEKVSDIVQVAELAVWASGTTEGLRWEITHLIKALPPQKLVLWAHPHLLRVGEAEREAEWTRFRDLLGSAFPRPLPERLGDARFLSFTPEFEPVLVGPTDWSAQKSALRTLLRSKGYPKPDPTAVTRFRRAALVAAVGVLLVAGVIGGGWFSALQLNAQKQQDERDQNAWSSLAFAFYYSEAPTTVAGHPDETLAALKKVPNQLAKDLSPAMMGKVLPVANHYIDIFATAHAHPSVEPLLYSAYYLLFRGVDSVAEAQKRRAELTPVSAAFAGFLRDWAHVRTITSEPWDRGSFMKVTNARAKVFESESAILQFLIDHSQGWKLTKYKDVSLPMYDSEALERQFIALLEARVAARDTFETSWRR